jgi:ferredoxin
MIDKTLVLVSLLMFGAFTYVAVVSVLDREKRAAAIGLLLSITAPIPFLAVALLDFAVQDALASALLAFSVVLTILILIPTKSPHNWSDSDPKGRIDERDIIFSRRLLEPGSARFDEYYARNPEKKAWDDKFRCRPGLLADGAALFDPYTFRAAEASFETIEHLRPYVDGPKAAAVVSAAPSDATRFLKGWALKLGAHSVGVTELQDFHLYSVVGRGPDYGSPVEREHDFAIALTVEMDKRLLDSGPHAPTVMESALKYVDSGIIAVQLAAFLRNLGYSARAHIDGNYRVICPLVARDAGLGEIGRMGLLMTPKLGPRVRIAVVTTNLPLLPDQRIPDDSVLDFCTHCQKCAVSCPPWAIPFEDREEIDGVSRWQIKQELCYIYWSHTGTDCGRCVAVCPYSHPDRRLHNFVRWGVRRSRIFRSAATVFDRLFYGTKPPPAPVPPWMNVGRRADG